jgi:uncharacterized membrane protein YqiK
MSELFAQYPILGVMAVPVAIITAYIFLSIRYIPNSKVGIVEKRFSMRGSLQSGIIALKGEAGLQPDVLRGGVHFLPWIIYAVHVQPLVTIGQGHIGYIFARDGRPLPPNQTLGDNTDADDFSDVRAFLTKGGQRGPQRKLLREGSYAINTAQFAVITERGVLYHRLEKGEEQVFNAMAQLLHERWGFVPVVIQGADDAIGIVTVHDGPSLSDGEIIAPTVGDDPTQPSTYHASYQDPERFLRAGGKRGRQLQVLVEGTYYINRLFATAEAVSKTVVDVGSVGVVVSYTGQLGKDLSGETYKHGELVQKGLRGVWSEPLLPGKYAFNTYAGKVIIVPTTNFILKWNRAESGSHKFDENLAEVSLITKDAFEPSLPLSVVVHIDYRKAPLVVQRFGDIKRLVEQTLDPMVAAYFKNIGQTRTLIQLIQDRSAIQLQSGQEMKEKFAAYNLELQEVLIGTPSGQGGQIEQILTQLRSRQIAEEQVETYSRQEKAAVKERELREAESRAKQQTHLTESELSITIQTNQGKADYARAQQQAAQVQVMAQAEREKIRLYGEGEAKKIELLASAEAERVARVGVAQALAVEEQVRAYGGPRFQLTQQVMNRFAEAIQSAGVDVVPKIVIGGANGNGASGGNGGVSGNVMEALLAMLLSDKIGGTLGDGTGGGPRSAAAEAIREGLKGRINGPSSPKV